MPAFIKSKKDEEVWSRAKARAHDQYGAKEDNKFWATVNAIYQRMRGHKEAQNRLDHVANCLDMKAPHLAALLDSVSNSLEA
jgi:hypothetical protein